MSTATTLLALLEPEPAHGYTLKQKFDTWFAQRRPLAFGQVYATLGRLERDGLAAMVGVDPGGGPDRRSYGITPAGVARVDQWVFESQAPDEFATSDLCARVTVALLSGRPVQRILDAQRAAHLERMRVLQELRRKATGADLLTTTYELAHLDADLRWIEESGTRIELLAKQIRKEGNDARGN